MLFQNFRSTEENAIRNLIEGSKNVYESTVVFLFAEASQFGTANALGEKLRKAYPFVTVSVICGGFTSCNGNIQEREAVTVTIMAGQFGCETLLLDDRVSRNNEGIAGVFLFAFGSTNVEVDLRKCETSYSGVPIM